MTAPEPEGRPAEAVVADRPEPWTSAAPRRLRRVHLVVSVVSVVAGVAVTVAALLLAGWRYTPVNRYEVRVFLDQKATAEQTEAARAVLKRLSSDGEVRLRSREENFADYRKTWADSGDTMPTSVTAASLPEALVIATTGRDFDCAPFATLKDQAGVDSVRVGLYDGDIVPVTATEC